jgi:soluble lytic murein transglycosylase-like protein
MKVGWNRRYVVHCLACQEWLSKAYKLLVLTVVLSSFVFAFPVATGVPVTPQQPVNPTVQVQTPPPAAPPAVPQITTAPIESMLARYGVQSEMRSRVATAIVNSGRKYDIDPRLVASIMIVESRANPFAISEADSIGIMQIHLPTWGPMAEEQGINLFKIEDNVDLGVRILKGYIHGNGIWEGVARYKGYVDTPASQQQAQEYVRKVQRVFGLLPDTTASLQ